MHTRSKIKYIEVQNLNTEADEFNLHVRWISYHTKGSRYLRMHLVKVAVAKFGESRFLLPAVLRNHQNLSSLRDDVLPATKKESQAVYMHSLDLNHGEIKKLDLGIFARNMHRGT